MSSGPLDFFELNITCSANTECYTHGLNLECRRTGYCGCMWSSSMGPAPVCNELTPASSMNLVVRFLTLALYLVPFVYALQLYIFTIRKSGCKWSYQISTVVFTILGPFFMLLANIMPLIDMLGGAVFSTVARNAIFNLGLALGSTLCILSYLNVSLMWVEFCLASKRLAALSHNLKLTKNFLRGYIVFHVVMSVIMLVLNVVVSDTFFLAFLGVDAGTFAAGGGGTAPGAARVLGRELPPQLSQFAFRVVAPRAGKELAHRLVHTLTHSLTHSIASELEHTIVSGVTKALGHLLVHYYFCVYCFTTGDYCGHCSSYNQFQRVAPGGQSGNLGRYAQKGKPAG